MIFSKVISISAILEGLREKESVIIVGCPWCAGFSIAYEKGVPYMRKSTNKDTGEVEYLPEAIMVEANHIKEALNGSGKKAEVEIYPGPCIYTDDMRLPESVNGGEMASPEMLERLVGCDAIVSLSCSSGVQGLRRRVGDSVSVVPGMRTVGIGQFSFKFDESLESVCIDKDRTEVISFT